MKTVLGLALSLVLSNVATADNHSNENFADRKQEVLKNMDEKIAHMNEMKSCISAAQDHMAMKACHGKMKEARQDMRMERMEHKDALLQKRMEKMKKRQAEQKQ